MSQSAAGCWLNLRNPRLFTRSAWRAAASCALAIGLQACCADPPTRITWENGTEARVRFGCGDARAVPPEGRDRSGLATRAGTRTVDLCSQDDDRPFATARLTFDTLPVCSPGARFEVVLRLEADGDGWRIVLPQAEDNVYVDAELIDPDAPDTDADTADSAL